MYIPDTEIGELKSLQASIIDAIEKIDNQSTTELHEIQDIQERIRTATDKSTDGFTLISPLAVCDICHSNLHAQEFMFFPCGHAFHTECYNSKLKNDFNDRKLMMDFNPGTQKFTVTNHKLCLICSISSVELIGVPYFTYYQLQEMNASQLEPFKGRPVLITDDRNENDDEYDNSEDY
ncbi:hypothetical protein TRFO_03084 [Tritrichomonas foetus]|uniref:RING-type domain-containing protein n=1 Tax=Tritrichomonas foetus TaxID=1144522 RepID=A0A1J4KYK2_9EUKA|nr:hypothetical protein TRFO_03084 [Tritrichomonas foetus]|eukprot:OHT14788.1 hypothetical protein TRFO_03084 [Tritrichomonas foetus]